jgi:hypothetical protein
MYYFKKRNIIWDLRGIGGERERERETSKQPEVIEGKGCSRSAAPVVLCCIIKKLQIGLD